MNQTKPEFSIVVPTFNMAAELGELIDSLESSGLAAAAQEVIWVDDGSTDDTVMRLEERLGASPVLRGKCRVLSLGANHGRFLARRKGAEAAVCPKVLFLDSRVRVASDFAVKLAGAASRFENIIPNVFIDESKNTFCLYWKRSHQFIFRPHFEALAQGPIELVPANFQKYLKGTTALWVDRAVFLAACQALQSDTVLNDDYRVLEEFVKTKPLTIVPELAIIWVPRENWRGFLHRLWSRGPSFVEYHFILNRGGFFWVVLLGLVWLVVWILNLAVHPAAALSSLLWMTSVAFLSTALFARTPLEFFRLAPLHLCVIGTFGSGILWGIGVNLRRREMRHALLRNLAGGRKHD